MKNKSMTKSLQTYDKRGGGPLFNFQYRWGRANFLVEILNISLVLNLVHKILAPTGSEIREERYDPST